MRQKTPDHTIRVSPSRHHQKNAPKHLKNHKANLVNICKPCHIKFTKENTVHRNTKTSNGYELVEQ